MVIAFPYLFVVANGGVVAYDIRAPAAATHNRTLLRLAASDFELAASKNRLWAVEPTDASEQTSFWWLDIVPEAGAPSGTSLGVFQNGKVTTPGAKRSLGGALVAVEQAVPETPALIMRRDKDFPASTELELRKVTVGDAGLHASALNPNYSVDQCRPAVISSPSTYAMTT